MPIRTIALLILILTTVFGENNQTVQPCEHHFIKILYGKPSTKSLQLAQDNKILLGGCMVGNDAPRYYCTKCKKKFKLSDVEK